MSSVISDLRYAARELRRRPGFTLTAVLSLALGVGATSAVFSVIHAVLINPFPYVGADRMMQISLKDKAGNFRGTGMNGAQIEQLRQARTVESIVGEDGWNLTTTDGDLPEDVVASYITPNAPNHWGTPALKGRWLDPVGRASRARSRNAWSCSATGSGSDTTPAIRPWSAAPSNWCGSPIRSWA